MAAVLLLQDHEEHSAHVLDPLGFLLADFRPRVEPGAVVSGRNVPVARVRQNVQEVFAPDHRFSVCHGGYLRQVDDAHFELFRPGRVTHHETLRFPRRVVAPDGKPELLAGECDPLHRERVARVLRAFHVVIPRLRPRLAPHRIVHLLRLVRRGREFFPQTARPEERRLAQVRVDADEHRAGELGNDPVGRAVRHVGVHLERAVFNADRQPDRNFERTVTEAHFRVENLETAVGVLLLLERLFRVLNDERFAGVVRIGRVFQERHRPDRTGASRH